MNRWREVAWWWRRWIFGMPPEAAYPASLADINYAIRWLKIPCHGTWGSRPDMVGILGSSSGGHQAMLAAMRPNDPRYAALPLPGKAAVDASVRCVVLCWPVIDPLGRYHYAKKLKEGGNAKQADEWISCHDQYWQGEAAMAEGNPTLALERGEPTAASRVVSTGNRGRGASTSQPRALHRDLPQGGWSRRSS